MGKNFKLKNCISKIKHFTRGLESSRVKVLLIQIYVTLNFIYRILVSNIYGISFIILAFYFILPHISSIKPYNFNELVMWYISLDKEYKVSMLSSILTIIGFLIAFQVATKNLTRQMQTNLRLEASKDIESSYLRATELILSIQIFTENCIDLINKIEKNILENEIHSGMTFLMSEMPKFISNRQELSNLHIKIYQLYTKHTFPIFACNSFSRLEKINYSLKLVAEKMWVFIPQVDLTNPNYKNIFLKFSDRRKLSELSLQCKESYMYISTMAGLIKGKLTSSLAEKNFATVISFWKQGKNMKIAFDVMKKKNK